MTTFHFRPPKKSRWREHFIASAAGADGPSDASAVESGVLERDSEIFGVVSALTFPACVCGLQ